MKWKFSGWWTSSSTSGHRDNMRETLLLRWKFLLTHWTSQKMHQLVSFLEESVALTGFFQSVFVSVMVKCNIFKPEEKTRLWKRTCRWFSTKCFMLPAENLNWHEPRNVLCCSAESWCCCAVSWWLTIFFVSLEKSYLTHNLGSKQTCWRQTCVWVRDALDEFRRHCVSTVNINKFGLLLQNVLWELDVFTENQLSCWASCCPLLHNPPDLTEKVL